MNRLLQRQIKRNFGKDFDISTLSTEMQKLLQSIDESYDDFAREQKLLEHTLEVNSEELTQINKITKNKNLEALSLLAQYKEAIDSAMIVSKSDVKGNITYVNDIFCKVSGYTREELLSKPHNIIRHPEAPPSIFKELWSTILSKRIWQGHIQNRAKNGSSYYVYATIIPILDTEGAITEFMALRENVTRRYLLEKKARYLHKRTQMIMDTQESMVIISDDKTGILEANKKFYTTTGYSDYEAFKKEYKCIDALFVKREGYLKKSTKNHFWAEELLNKPEEIHKAILYDAEAREIVFDVRGKEIILDGQKYVISTFSDITNVEKMRELAEAAQKTKSNFLANMSHEIRTPMNGISGFLQLLEKTSLDEKQKRYLDITQTSVHTLLKIINDILDFSKIESGHMESELVQINPFKELEKSFMTFMPKAHEKNISYQIHIHSDIAEGLLVDMLHLGQVMQNLINNAIKFTPEQGTIIVDVSVISQSSLQQKLRFSVSDSGIGIAKENHEKILKAFSQADNSTTREFGGTGLGLSISNSLVSLMGGELLLKSELGEGSNFYFDLDLKKVHDKEYKTLAKHLSQSPVCFIDHENEYSNLIMQQLKNFHINYNKISQDSVNMSIFEEMSTRLIITTSSKDASLLSKNENFVIILIDENREELQNISNLNIINSYENCPSTLYNILLEQKVIVQDVSSISSANSYKLNILIAEDYEINRILIEELLNQYKGIEYTFAHNGKEAVELYTQQKHFDLILMDINMPILDGVQATKQLRLLGVRTPIVALTANVLKEDRKRFLSLGMNDYLSKPLDIQELERVLEPFKVKENKSEILKNSKEHILKHDTIEEALAATAQHTKFPQKIVLKLLNSYVASFETLLNSFYEGLQSSDFQKIERASHDLKSSSQTLYFLQIGEEAAECEKHSRAQSSYHYQESYDMFLLHLKRLQEYLKK